MPVHHIVLLKLKPDATKSQIEDFASAAKAMVGQVPGLSKMDVGEPSAVSAHRAMGFNFGLVALLDREDDIAVYGAHDSHQPVIKLREQIASDALAFDLLF